MMRVLSSVWMDPTTTAAIYVGVAGGKLSIVNAIVEEYCNYPAILFTLSEDCFHI